MKLLLNKGVAGLLILLMALQLDACTLGPIYTSRDVARLPCETTASKFFYPVEFNADGNLLYEDQLQTASAAASSARDIVIFVHGWDKTTGSAERDYQDFLCRLFWRGVETDYLLATNTMVVGVFWPSTVFRNYEDFPIIKPFTYYIIRDRADRLAKEGIQKRLLPGILGQVENHKEKRLHVIGHSFGGRMLISTVANYFKTRVLEKGTDKVSYINFVLLLPAIEPDRGHWLVLPLIHVINELLRAVDEVMAQSGSERAPTQPITADYLKVFIVHSARDWVNHYLFPFSEALRLRKPWCSVGACGEPFAPTITVDESGLVKELPNNPARVWNVKADAIISSHSDIYKGRVAGLIWSLITAKEITQNSQTSLP